MVWELGGLTASALPESRILFALANGEAYPSATLAVNPQYIGCTISSRLRAVSLACL